MKQLSLFFLLSIFVAPQLKSTNCFRMDPIDAVIEFYQNGKKVKVKNNEVILKKDYFTIKITYKQAKESSLLFNLRIDDKNYKAALKNKKLDVTPASGFAEYQHNMARNLIIDTRAYHSWFWASEANHRYNKVEEKNGILTCEREVNFITFMNKEREMKNIKDISQNVLYGVFFQNMDEWSDKVESRIIMPIKITFK